MNYSQRFRFFGNSKSARSGKVIYFSFNAYLSQYNLLVSVQTPMYSTRAFWKERPMSKKYDHYVSQKDITS